MLNIFLVFLFVLISHSRDNDFSKERKSLIYDYNSFFKASLLKNKPYSKPKDPLYIPSILFFIQMNSACLTQARMISDFPHGLVS